MDLHNIDLSKLKYNSQGYEGVQLSDEHEAIIKKAGAFVDEARNSKLLTCDEECRKNEKENLLYFDYLQAKQTAENAPNMLEESEKNFYTFSKGGLWYQNMIEQKKEEEATTLVNRLYETYNNKSKEFGLLLNKYKDQKLYGSHIDELADSYTSRLDKVRKNIRNKKNKTNVANRKTYYEQQNKVSVINMNIILSYIYKLLVGFYIIFLLILKKQYKNTTLLGIAAALILYPYMMPYIIEAIVYIYNGISKYVK
jgi:hypothetical protein